MATDPIPWLQNAPVEPPEALDMGQTLLLPCHPQLPFPQDVGFPGDHDYEDRGDTLRCRACGRTESL